LQLFFSLLTTNAFRVSSSYGKELYNKYIDLFAGATSADSFDTEYHPFSKPYQCTGGEFTLDIGEWKCPFINEHCSTSDSTTVQYVIGSEVEGAVGGAITMPVELKTEQQTLSDGSVESNAVFKWKDPSQKRIPRCE
jgi:hypothetical protein